MRSLLRCAQAFTIAFLMLAGLSVSTSAQEAAEEVHVNVIRCADPDCTDVSTMEGATVTTYDASGTMIDFCTVSAASFGCDVLALPIDGYFEISAASEFQDHQLISEAPEVVTGGAYEVAYNWYYVRLGQVPPTVVPGDKIPVVKDLPATGAGEAPSQLPIVVGATLVTLVVAAGVRGATRTN